MEKKLHNVKVGLIVTIIWLSAMSGSILPMFLNDCRPKNHPKVDDNLEAEMCWKPVLGCIIRFYQSYTREHRFVIEDLGGEVYASFPHILPDACAAMIPFHISWTNMTRGVISPRDEGFGHLLPSILARENAYLFSYEIIGIRLRGGANATLRPALRSALQV